MIVSLARKYCCCWCCLCGRGVDGCDFSDRLISLACDVARDGGGWEIVVVVVDVADVDTALGDRRAVMMGWVCGREKRRLSS